MNCKMLFKSEPFSRPQGQSLKDYVITSIWNLLNTYVGIYENGAEELNPRTKYATI